MHKNDILRLTVKESGYKQSRVTPHFSNGQNLLKKILRKEIIWQKLLKNISKKDK